MRRIWIGFVVAALPLTIVCSSATSSSYALARSITHTAAQAVSEVSPNFGSTGGGTPITITGSGFVQGDTVVIGQGQGPCCGAIAATKVRVASSTQITATTGGGAQPGTRNLWVIPPNGSASQAVTSATFTYTGSPPPSRSTLTVTKIASATGNESFYNTFGPWDQHVLFDGSSGIFALVHTTQNLEGSCECGYFKLMRSTNNGATWTAIYDSRPDGIKVQDPTIDKDASGNLYVTGNDMKSGVWQTHIWRFQAGAFSRKTHALIRYGSSKYSMVYDPAHKEVDIATWFNGNKPNFIAIGASTLAVVKTVNLFASRQPYPNVYDDVEYPNLSIGPHGQVFLGWTTEDVRLAIKGTQNYYDAHFLVTTNGGSTWHGPNGPVTLPIYGSDSRSWEIVKTSDPAEFERYGRSSYKGNWNTLDSLLWNDGGMDFAYWGEIPQEHESFARLNWGKQIFVHRTDNQVTAEGDGFGADSGLSQNASYAGSIYRTGHEGGRIVTAVSTDDGSSWHTFAKSRWSTSEGITYVDPSRVLGPHGEVGAVFTLLTGSHSSDAYFVHSG
jgi:hypothetical protein